MAKTKRKRKKKSPVSAKKVVGIVLFLAAMLMLVALITHRHIDDTRLTGELDDQLSPFEIKYHNQGGMIGAYLSYYSLTLFGWLSFFIPFGLILVSLRMFQSELAQKLRLSAILLFILGLISTMIYNIHLLAVRELGVGPDSAGGWITKQLTLLFIKIVGEAGSYIILSGAILILLVVFTPIAALLSANIKLPKFTGGTAIFSFLKAVLTAFFSFEWMKKLLVRDKDELEEDDDGDYEDYEEEDGKVVTVAGGSFEEQLNTALDSDDSDDVEVKHDRPDKKKAKRKAATVKSAEQLQLGAVAYAYPKLDLLKENPNKESSVSSDELKLTSRMLAETLETFNVRIEGDIAAYPGPIITRYEFKPGSGIKINQIVNLADDLALALKAKRIRIVAPIPGKAAVGVEIPNRNPQMVFIRDILSSEEYRNAKLILPLALGKSISGKPYVADLTKMPHLLIAGATGSGKSVGMNVMITSLLYRLHPHQVRFIFIDPKMLELSVYAGIPHLGRPVVTKPKRAEKVLADAVVEMERRYRKLANATVRNIADYNAKQTDDEKKLPYIVICVDELADLMMSATSSKIEQLITRLAQMSRAVGIHLILATQRPSVDVITGLIKANFPARIAYQVSTKVDSRTIIDGNGAEKLLGNGDMLFLETGQPEPKRIHGAYLSSEETEAIVTSINDQGIEMMALEGITQSTGEPTEREIDFGDPLFKEACEVVVRHKQGSVSLLQRRLGIGYQRAARLIDNLEQAGIVSAFTGSKARDVLVDKAYLETLFVGSEQTQELNSD